MLRRHHAAVVGGQPQHQPRDVRRIEPFLQALPPRRARRYPATDVRIARVSVQLEVRPFDGVDAARAAQLAPHIARAVLVSDRLAGLRQEVAMTGEALERIPQATLLVDADACVLFANRTARLARLPQAN